MKLPKRFQILADAICMRIRTRTEWIAVKRTLKEQDKYEAQMEAYYDVLGMLLKAVQPPEYPTVDCALNVANAPKQRDAKRYYEEWINNGGKTM